MADLIYRFRNDLFGGNQDITLSLDQMPNWFPINEEVRQNSHIADNGQLWQYTWYRKQVYNLQFQNVGTVFAGTMGSFVSEGFRILWYKDVNAGAAGGTGTVTYTGGFNRTPVAPNIVDFSFNVREI